MHKSPPEHKRNTSITNSEAHKACTNRHQNTKEHQQQSTQSLPPEHKGTPALRTAKHTKPAQIGTSHLLWHCQRHSSSTTTTWTDTAGPLLTPVPLPPCIIHLSSLPVNHHKRSSRRMFRLLKGINPYRSIPDNSPWVSSVTFLSSPEGLSFLTVPWGVSSSVYFSCRFLAGFYTGKVRKLDNRKMQANTHDWLGATGGLTQ